MSSLIYILDPSLNSSYKINRPFSYYDFQNLQQSIPDARVTIIADKFGEQTTSDGAAGIFRPTEEKLEGTPIHLQR